MRSLCIQLARTPLLQTADRTALIALRQHSIFRKQGFLKQTKLRNLSVVPCQVEEGLDKYEIEPEILNNLKDLGIKDLFPVQSQTIESARDGKDLLVQSKTGSGKTLAFGLPLLEKIIELKKEGWAKDGRRKRPQPLGVILAPTRELALQVHSELQKYSKSVISACIYGGVPYHKQLPALNNPRGLDLLIGTPGRVADLLSTDYIDLSQVRVAVLDEADEMLKMGFAKEVDSIYDAMPSAGERQNLLFSATFASDVKRIAEKYMEDAEKISLVSKDDSRIPEGIEMLSMVSRWKNREEQLGNILSMYCGGENGVRALVFTSTKLKCDELSSSKAVVQSGVLSLPLHGDMSQEARENALKAFRDRRVKCLIATDVAARGLDIPEVDLVIHFELPMQPESFVHRTGRTGRAGRKGMNIVMHDPRDWTKIERIERHIQRELVPTPQPKTRDIVDTKGAAVVQKLLNMSPRSVSYYESIAERFQAHLQSEGIELDPLAAAICLASGFESSQSFSDITGDNGVETLHITTQVPGLLRLPKSVRGKRINKSEMFKVKNQTEKIIADILHDNGHKPYGRIVRNLEICEDLEGVLVDILPNVAEKLLSADQDRAHELFDALSFNSIQGRIPPYIRVERSERKSGRYSENRSDRKWGNSRRGSNRRNFAARSNRSPKTRRNWVR